ncbi:Gluconate 2-dehydrogenase cytochrome c subunit [Pseudohongiella spirulinae]|uniref:Gluconate 2-dehydrogenase cytochrome c subunit n=2 Tax=Pseudohongiella spirulinae TaxID=1249552 RepID=A0A0S2KHF6_9GAMM|nr:Gluconate 2-dehydrogenase cytochrome c subunit [Pseudohongiella spirulinae]
MSDARFILLCFRSAVTCRWVTRQMFIALSNASIALFLLPVSSVVAARDSIDPGQYILYAGGCISCHTSDTGPDLAGGVPFEMPFGRIYSTNITPDVETGIGGWSNEQFANAMRKGILPDGGHLYPVFPYTSYTLISDEDIDLLYNYLMSIPPVRFVPPDNALRFPFDQRWLIGAWKRLFFDESRFVPATGQSDQWNRGAYLVEGLGHCGACHTPRGLLGNEKQQLAMTGATYRDEVDGKFLDWSATNLTQAGSGLKLWSNGQIEEYLKLGFSERAGVFGPMNRVVLNSTSHLHDEDIIAMAVYLKSLPALEQNMSVSKPAPDVMRRGEIVYDVHCGICHQPNGEGAITTGPPLVGSAVALAPDPASLINITLYGPQLPHEPVSPQWQARRWEAMESYYDTLTDSEVAEVLTYIRNAWTNSGSVVTAEQVRRQR